MKSVANKWTFQGKLGEVEEYDRCIKRRDSLLLKEIDLFSKIVIPVINPNMLGWVLVGLSNYHILKSINTTLEEKTTSNDD